MASTTQHSQEYTKAVSAYVQGQYDQAATITDGLVTTRPDDPNLRLLRGHIYCCQQEYDAAHEEYQRVLTLTTDTELISCANESLAKIQDMVASQPSQDSAESVNTGNGNGSAQWQEDSQTSIQSDYTVLQSNMPADLDLGSPSPADPENAFGDSLEAIDSVGADVSDQELFNFDPQAQFDSTTDPPTGDPFALGHQDLGDLGDLDNLGNFGGADLGAEISFEDPFGDLPELSEEIAVTDQFDDNDDDLTMAMDASPLGSPESSPLDMGSGMGDDDLTIAMGESPLGTDALSADFELDNLEINDLEISDQDQGLFDFGGPESEAGASLDLGSAIAETEVSEESFAGDALFTSETDLLEELPESADILEATPADISDGISDLFAQASEEDHDLDPDFGDAALFPETVAAEEPLAAYGEAEYGEIDEAESLFDDFGGSDHPEAETPLPNLDFEEAGIVAESLSPEQFDQTLIMDENDATMAFGANFPAPSPDTFSVPEEDEAAQALADLPEFDDLDLSNDSFDFDGDDDLTIANPQVQNFDPDTLHQDGGTETFAVLPGELGASEGLADLDFSLDADSPLELEPPEVSQEDLAAEMSAWTNIAEMPEPIGQEASTLGSVVSKPAKSAGGDAASSPSPSATGRDSSASGTGRPSAPSSLGKQNMTTAVTTGVVSALAAGLVGFGLSERPQMPPILLAGAAAGLAGGVASFALGQRNVARMKRCTTDLQAQCNAIIGGDMSAKVPVTSEDEFGQLASSFNQMTESILTVTGDAQKKAEENERQRDDLQRQVIRLLDDVEGAARGDLTVQAEVTADVLGAVADSFNLTIHNLRTIVQQVKVAARQVNRGAADNEAFARSLSSDALRQAEELAVTLNSMQMMTNAIQRVADSAKEANDVARSASETALKGGEAVERTVAGILQIRETVAETTRKVKRLAESSQEIAKIVGVISQIASRTNLLALNASIEAARAGESGRGFAVVADEVRQLADRAAKASKEIEQIVLQIQSETGAVMTAMEEGTQQVIDGTKRAEQAKRSLEDIIQVSSQIDTLVRSITNATVEQTETARSMAQVMQSVELTAQATSQEAQRVSDSLQGLVSVARGLQTSVEKFRVEQTEDQG
ncbi:methyl-accepting chemotaxis protein [Candidatus Synechococcus calcipolaris G9]|uniref:Methyl-accepting chemotaxis protein n=1 Tax=Candidatus Synechococcus calcipolaris G9 TaxID=1497997 RepID=A0ABT6EV62_9SYNE|nr:methyl-accepting chemotaxis protein [Candidatus Synechococcus calcipolaris]MDG2989712.1 methyl-accepting chemotaxis protein [Candidatus Synechococcus calcipolaris G9]